MSVAHAREVTRHGDDQVVREHVRYTGEDGAAVELRIAYSLPRILGQTEGDMAVRYPDIGATHLRYWNDEVQELIFAATENFDVREEFSYTIASPHSRELFGGAEELTAIVAVPASRRLVYASGPN